MNAKDQEISHDYTYVNRCGYADYISDYTGYEGGPHFFYRSNSEIQGKYVKHRFAASYHD